MALKNIVVATSDTKVVLFPRAKDEGERVTLNAKQSAAVRKHVKAFAASDERFTTHAARLAENKRVGMKPGNSMMPGIKVAMGDTVEPEPKNVQEVSVEEAMEEAEARDAIMSKAAAIKRSNMSADNKKMLLALMGL